MADTGTGEDAEARRAALEDERDHLLASLEDLEREHDAGDLDDADFETLRDDYTARTAAVLRALADDTAGDRPVDARPADVRSPDGTGSDATGSPRWRGPVVAAVVLALALGAGVLVARSSGQRGAGTLTGNDDTVRARLANCQPLAFSDPEAGVECYDDLLAESPDNVEALTYQGWALVRSGRIVEGSERFDRVVELDESFPDVHVFRAVVAARAADAARQRGDREAATAAYTEAADELAAFYRNDPSAIAEQVLRQELLEVKVFLGLLDPPTSECWTRVITGRGDGLAFDQALYDELATCLDQVLAASPGSVDALVSRGVAALGPERADPAVAAALADQALALDPTDANARLLQAAVALGEQRLDTAAAALTVLDSGPWPTVSFLLGTPQQLRQVLEAAERGSAGPPSTGRSGTPQSGGSPTASVSTVPGAPPIPNAGGG
ncbi:MAG: tetratricopeptide repeat protein [Microthrixaceae bacterium]